MTSVIFGGVALLIVGLAILILEVSEFKLFNAEIKLPSRGSDDSRRNSIFGWVLVCIGIALAVIGLISVSAPKTVPVVQGATPSNSSTVGAATPSPSAIVLSASPTSSVVAPSVSASPSPSTTIDNPSPSLSSSVTAGPLLLSNTQPVDNGQDGGDPVNAVISGRDYANSVEEGCVGGSGGKIVWDSAGYKRFIAVVGIADDASDATGQTAIVKFLNQDNIQLHTIEVSKGHPASIDIALGGAVSLEVNCVSANQFASYFISLGNATLVP